MTKEEAIALIDEHKNKLINPVEMLNWVWLRVILLNISEEAWSEALSKAEETLRK